jgi:hypothetical protein
MVLLGLDSEIFKSMERNVKLWIIFIWVRFYDRGANFRITNQRSASRNGLCSTELVSNANQ